MDFGGLLRDPQLGGDLFVQAAADAILQHLALPRRETHQARLNVLKIQSANPCGRMPFQCLLNGLNERSIIDALLQEIHRTLLHRVHAGWHVAVSGQEDNRQGDHLRGCQIAQFRSRHSRHTHVENHAARSGKGRPCQNFPGGGKRPLNTFHGLPGLLADSLPDRFGNALINAWLARQGRTPESFNAVERLCYTGKRGMGALEFMPVLGLRARTSTKVEVDALVALASEILTRRDGFRGDFSGPSRRKALNDILQVGTSAGGARAKAVIARNPDTNEVRSGQIPAGPGFEYWLLKSDGVSGNKDKELEDPKGVWRDRVRLSPDWQCGGNPDERVPTFGGRRSQTLHDPTFRLFRKLREAVHAIALRIGAFRL